MRQERGVVQRARRVRGLDARAAAGGIPAPELRLAERDGYAAAKPCRAVAGRNRRTRPL